MTAGRKPPPYRRVRRSGLRRVIQWPITQGGSARAAAVKLHHEVHDALPVPRPKHHEPFRRGSLAKQLHSGVRTHSAEHAFIPKPLVRQARELCRDGLKVPQLPLLLSGTPVRMFHLYTPFRSGFPYPKERTAIKFLVVGHPDLQESCKFL